MGAILTPKEIANVCISAGFNDYEPHIYDTIRIGQAIERAIEAERAQMADRSQDAGSGQHVSGDTNGATDEQGQRRERATPGKGRALALVHSRG